MKYSFIFCYRDRSEHLRLTVPRVKELATAGGIDHEIIVVEQNDGRKFRRGNLLNEGAKAASGDVMIFHDVDYYPTDDAVYWHGGGGVYLPVKYVNFVYNDLTPKPITEVPGGYRHFRYGVDDDFFGGVTTFTRDEFFKINGFSPLFVGWGFEDVDLRRRIEFHGLNVARNSTGRFLALDHPDSGPPAGDADFRRNIEMARDWKFYAAHGVSTQPSNTTRCAPPMNEIDVWLKATDFDGTPEQRHIVASSYAWDAE